MSDEVKQSNEAKCNIRDDLFEPIGGIDNTISNLNTCLNLVTKIANGSTERRGSRSSKSKSDDGGLVHVCELIG